MLRRAPHDLPKLLLDSLRVLPELMGVPPDYLKPHLDLWVLPDLRVLPDLYWVPSEPIEHSKQTWDLVEALQYICA